MIETAVSAFIVALGVYAVIGFLTALYLHAGPLARMDESANGAGLAFRLLITPGLVGLWPVMLLKSRRSRFGNVPFGSQLAPNSPRQLRKTHGLITIVLAVLLPVLVWLAIELRPDTPLVDTGNLPPATVKQ